MIIFITLLQTLILVSFKFNNTIKEILLIIIFFYYCVTNVDSVVFIFFPAMIAPVLIALTVGFVGLAYQALKPPPPKICGSPNGPPVTSPRVKLSDGRHLAYRELGVPKEEAKHKIIIVHGFDSSKDLTLPVAQV